MESLELRMGRVVFSGKAMLTAEAPGTPLRGFLARQESPGTSGADLVPSHSLPPDP